jgi:hypothetical protein
MTKEQRATFEEIEPSAIWPEVGSRAMNRLLIMRDGQVFHDTWIEVQPDRYRYAVIADGGVLVRLVIDEYLAAEIRWDGSAD